MVVSLLASTLLSQSAPFSALVRVSVPAKFEELTSTIVSDAIRTNFKWSEAIVSWNVSNMDQAWMKVEAQGVWPNRTSRWFTLADWTGDLAKGPRTSILNQKDSDGEVQTDLLKLNEGCNELRLRISTRKVAEGPDPSLKLLTISFSGANVPDSDAEPNRSAFGKIIEVPRLAQGPFEFGKLNFDPDRVSPNFKTWFAGVKQAQYCSPTCVSMVASHWATKQKRPDLAVSVPQVVAGVFDEQYPGTGNWPFNTAFLGSFPGMRSYVTRLGSISDLEALIASDIPVICSVSSNLLKGKPPGGDGHLVVLVGFDKLGDPVFNDPADEAKIRRTYARSDFIKAWNQSKRTVYIVHPEAVRLPRLTDLSVLSN